jgi:hypothetical protein
MWSWWSSVVVRDGSTVDSRSGCVRRPHRQTIEPNADDPPVLGIWLIGSLR